MTSRRNLRNLRSLRSLQSLQNLCSLAQEVFSENLSGFCRGAPACRVVNVRAKRRGRRQCALFAVVGVLCARLVLHAYFCRCCTVTRLLCCAQGVASHAQGVAHLLIVGAKCAAKGVNTAFRCAKGACTDRVGFLGGHTGRRQGRAAGEAWTVIRLFLSGLWNKNGCDGEVVATAGESTPPPPRPAFFFSRHTSPPPQNDVYS